MSRHRRQFFVEAAEVDQGRVTIHGPSARHITTVLRLGRGDFIHLVVEGEGTYEVCITKASPAAVDCVLISPGQWEKSPRVGMVLAQAVPKGSAMDSIIRRATELGAGAVVPIQAERSVSLLKGNRGLQKLERWRRTARQAAQQSSRLTVPRIEPVQSLSRFLQGSAQADVKIMLHQEEKAMGLSRVLSGIKGAEKANLLVGPEGGFTPREVEEAREDGYSVVSLGARILRTETASLALLSILMYEMGEMEP